VNKVYVTREQLETLLAYAASTDLTACTIVQRYEPETCKAIDAVHVETGGICHIEPNGEEYH
jgi:hypothetical protein